MNRKISLLQIFIFVSLILTVFAGQYLHNVNNKLNQSKQCILVDNACFFRTQSFVLGINFQQMPILEEELFINFELSQGYQINKAWIEGINMFMGKTQVLFEERAFHEQTAITRTKGVTFLGSCSEPNMQWQLFVEVENKAKQIEVYSALFNTKIK